MNSHIKEDTRPVGVVSRGVATALASNCGGVRRGFMGMLSSAEADMVKRAATPVALPAGKTLTANRAAGHAVFVLDSGLVGRMLPLPDGRLLGINLEGQGALIGGEPCLGEATSEEAIVLITGSGWRVARSS